jgi:hypothetical protein
VNDLVGDVPVVAVGELIGMREAAGIQVTSSSLLYSTRRAQIMTIRIQSVLAGKNLVAPRSTVEALVFPKVAREAKEHPSVTFYEAHEEYKQTGRWPWYWHYPEIGLGEPQIFFLDKVREREKGVDESVGVTEVTGITSHYLEKHFYVYARSLAVKPSTLSIVKRYAEINDIRDAERHEQELMEFSLSLIEDRNTPETLATYATIDLGKSLYWKKPGFGWLTESRMEKLIAVATDRSRPNAVRSWITQILETAHKYRGRRIPVEPFLRVIADSQDDVNLRAGFIYFLEQLNTPEVREGFKRILQHAPRTRDDEVVWGDLRASKVLKEEP